MGIPQGRVIGRILSITYISSLTDNNLNICSAKSYADDSAGVFSENSWEITKKTAKLCSIQI